ncbi:MAG: aminotransferase class I/II-fold pyridoxal phosphate-dependent enzyme [Acidobacteria bacterium]|nr:aminotransferase class I/II-fold pyridoxal phosphate-dependent enzyme [Acidobacteriota bacterium]
MRAQFEESPPGPIHGGLNPRELESLGLCPEEVLDFSASKNFLEGTLSRMGLECLPSAANFLLIRVGDASRLRLELLKRYKICVRDCGSFGLPEHIRVGVRNIEDSRRLVRALKLATATISENHE